MRRITQAEANRRLGTVSNLAELFKAALPSREAALKAFNGRVKPEEGGTSGDGEGGTEGNPCLDLRTSEGDDLGDSSPAPVEPEVLTEEGKLNLALASLEIGPTAAAAEFGVTVTEAESAELGKSGSLVKSFAERRLEKALNKASVVLLRSLGVLTQDKLEKVSAKDAASIAKDAASVVEKLEQRGAKDRKAPVIIYMPEARTVNQYESVDVIASSR